MLAFDASTDKANYEKYQKYKEKNLGNSGRTGGNSTESKDTGYNCNDKKYDGPFKHNWNKV